MMSKFDKYKHPFMIKTLRKLGIELNFLTVSKGIDKNPTDSIILNSKRLKSFLLRSEKEQRYLLSLLLFNIVLELLTRATRQEKTIKESKLERKN